MRLWPSTILFAACTGGMQDPTTVEQQEGACIALEGLHFESVNELECGRTPDGVGLCKWSVSFATRDDISSTFQWRYSDVSEGGQIECDGAAIASITGRSINGTYEAATQKLVWEGHTYTLVP